MPPKVPMSPSKRRTIMIREQKAADEQKQLDEMRKRGLEKRLKQKIAKGLISDEVRDESRKRRIYTYHKTRNIITI